jgi:hypothetical protein
MTTAPSFPGYPPPVPAPPAGPPPPPPGPGVQPPFPAPPIEGRGRRIGWGLGIGAGLLLLICGGGFVLVLGLTTAITRSYDEGAHKAVSAYLDALHARRYDQAYALLCQQAKDDETPAEFRGRVSAMEPIASYQLGDLDVVHRTIPVAATYENGDTAQLEAYFAQNDTTGDFEVCDVGE